ncbi:MAG: tyrosine--tRNA ligase [Calditrichaeota bacterium]|nr:MAG: tyrosine--tRNA ligase [Calditrichota bacterium]MBL1206515.1 tyrosine--tRNA ligase [Calditrichota bacterium]NOG46343.1 tyrosine--tRNA ligase [Calditrichota bacterium]
MKFPSLNEQMDLIKRGTIEVLPEDEMVKKIERSIKKEKPLIIKQGFDPTAPDIHLGHTVGIRKLKHFQDLGHQVVVIIGDYTAMVGDPSDKKSTRPRLSHEQVMAHAKTYQDQFFKILDEDKTQVRFNGDWFKEMSFEQVMNLAGKFTVARMLERDDFSKRYAGQQPISIHEFFYPLMQGYDSVVIKSDVELGATEQKFNLVIGRSIQKEYEQEPQCILTLPVLEGLDGKQRMSKSTGNYIGIDEPGNEIYGKTMSIPDEMIYRYFELITDVDAEELVNIKNQLDTASVNPRDLKKYLGRTLVRMYHGEGQVDAAEKAFENLFVKKDVPDEMPEMKMDEPEMRIVDLMVFTKTAESKGAARRLVQGGAVSIDGEKINDPFQIITNDSEKVLKVGKRKFVRILKA